MLQGVQNKPIVDFKGGLNTSFDILSLQDGESPACMNVEFIDTSVQKRLGVSSQNTVQVGTGCYGMMDFGVGITPQERRLIIATGTGIMYSTDVGRTWASCLSSKAATFTNFAYVKNWTVYGDESYGIPMYWTGSTTSQFQPIATDSAPIAKFPVSHLGYLFYLNETNNVRGVYYVDDSQIFTTASWDNFQLPSGRNDEITAGFVLRKIMYISTRYKIFKITYVGGSPYWAYVEVKSWGFVPRTVCKISVGEAGEIMIGLDYSKNLRVFNGSDDEILSTRFENNNGLTEFYLKNLNANQLTKCWAEVDQSDGVYKLFVPYGDANESTHCINFNFKHKTFYPFSNQNYSCGVQSADTANGLHFLVAGTDGRIYRINSGNTDTGTPVNDYLVSNLLFSETPSQVNKAQKVDLYFSVTSSNTLYYEDREDFSSIWSTNKIFNLKSDINAVQTSQTIDIPKVTSVYQFKLSSSANTSDPWRLNRVDYLHTPLGYGRA